MPIQLPLEIIHDILALTLSTQNSSLALLTTCSTFRDIVQQFLYTQLHFSSRTQLHSFISTYKLYSVPHSPRTIEVDITGTEDNLVFSDLHTLFSQCVPGTRENAERDETGRLVLDLLRLCVNSHTFDPNAKRIYSALSLVNPRRFIWTGPDPSSHFSIAIVPSAITQLFQALSSYTNLKELKLTHISMLLHGNFHGLPRLPSLKVLYLGQVVFLHPSTIARFILGPDMKDIGSVKLVDAYTESIWGPRLRRSDVEHVGARCIHDQNPMATLTGTDWTRIKDSAIDRIQRVLVCEGKTERIMGGDRVETHTNILI